MSRSRLVSLNSNNFMPPEDVERMFGVKLAPCPFCGSRFVGLWLGPSPHVHCPSCQADGPCIEGDRSELQYRQFRAAQAWNGRAHAPSLAPAAIALELFKILERLGADEQLLSIVGSWKDTMNDEEVLELLREYNKTGKVMQGSPRGNRIP